MNFTENQIIGTGARAKVYLHEGFAYKLYDKDVYAPGVYAEALIGTLITDCGLPSPKILGVYSTEDGLVIKQTYIKNRPFNDIIRENPEKAAELFGKFIALQNEVHSKTFLLPISYKDKLRDKLMATHLSDDEKLKLCRYLNSLKDGESLCHGDFHGGNVLVDDDEKLWVIDWADASRGNTLCDVCRTYMIYAIYAPEVAEIYLSAYCAISNAKKEDVLAWLPVLSAARLVENFAWETDKLKNWMILK